MGWKAIADKWDGLATVKHAVITINGTWGSGLVQYPSNVVNGLAYLNEDLCYEVVCPYPASFGFIGGSITAPSYQQSVADAMAWMRSWLAANPLQTFILVGYSQGGEAASRIAIELMSGSLTQYRANFVGGITFGNPCRGAGFVAPDIADPGGHGISSVLMTERPTVNGEVVWADYVHSTANGDAGDDMYAFVPDGPAGKQMTDVYTIATQAQLNAIGTFTGQLVGDLTTALQDVAAAPADVLVAAQHGIAFLTAPGGPTAPHISYLGELPGYSNLVGQAVGFLRHIASLTPARCAA